MSSIIETIKSQLGDDVVENISKQLGENVDKVRAAIDQIIPMIMKGFSNKAGDQGFMSLLDADGDGDIDLNDVTALFNGAGKDATETVNNLLGDKKEMVAKSVASESGVSESSAVTLIERITALVTENIKKIQSEGGIESVMAMVTKEVEKLSKSDNPIVKQVIGFLDQDGDGDLDMDDLKKVGGGFIGKLFGGK